MEDIKQLVINYLGHEISADEFYSVYNIATRKQAHIISIIGTKDKEVIKPYYLAQLISEIIHTRKICEYTEKECAAKANAPSY